MDRLSEWLAGLQFTKRFSRHTVDAYQRDMADFLAFMDGHVGECLTVEQLTALFVRDFRAWMAHRSQTHTNRSTARALSVIRHYYRFLEKEKGLRCEALASLKSPRVKVGLPKPLSIDQTKDLVETIEDLTDIPWVAQRNRAILVLLYGAGLRISEALGLNRDCLPLGDTLVIRGKGSKERVVPLLPKIREEIEKYAALCPFALEKKDALFVGVQGKRLNAGMVQKLMRTYRRLVGLPETATPHALRHSCATHLMNASGDLRAIQDLLGHASLSSTQVYTNLETQKLLDVYQAAHPRR